MNKLLCESIVYCDFYWSYCSLWASWLTIKHLFVVVCLYSSGKTFIAHWLQGNQMTWLCSVCPNHNPVLSSCMTYHWMCHKSNTRVSHVEQELITLPNHPSSLPPLFGRVCVAQSLVFCVVFCRPLFVHFLLPCMPFFNYPFGIFKLFMVRYKLI